MRAKRPPAKLPDRDFYTVPEIARALRCRESTAAGLVKSGRLAAVNLSEGQRPRYRIARQALDAFLANQAVTAAVPPVRRQRTSVPSYV